MKVIYVHQYFNTRAMAGGTRSLELASRLVAAGHDVHVITTDREPRPDAQGWRESVEQGVTVHWAPISYHQRMRPIRRIAAFLSFAARASHRGKAIGGDIVFATSTPLTVAIPGRLIARSLKVPMVLEVRDLWPQAPIALGVLRSRLSIYLAKRLEGYAYHGASAIVTVSPPIAEIILRHRASPSRVEVIPNGADLDLFREVPKDSEPFLSGTSDRTTITYAGSLGQAHGPGFIVDVAVELALRDPEIVLVIAGIGSQSDLVRDAAESAGILNRTFFMLGSIPKAEVPRLLSHTDIALSTANSAISAYAADGGQLDSPNKVFDALAAGVPVAFNHEGWVVDLVVEAGAGIRLPADDPGGAAELLQRTLADSAWLATARDAAKRLAAGPFSRDSHGQQLEALLLDVVRSHPSRRTRARW
jgi:glycosyltransferase involved in cell wall biosynthesis